MDGVELRDGLAIRIRVAGRGQRPLWDMDVQERDVEAALAHFRQIELCEESPRVVALGREVGGVEVDVRVDGEKAFVDRPGVCDEGRVWRLGQRHR